MDVKVLNFVILFSQSSTKKVYYFSLSKGKKIPSELHVYTFRLLLLTRVCIFGGDEEGNGATSESSKA